MKNILLEDTIVAIITPPGEGGIAALRIAGNDARSILSKHFKPQQKNRGVKPFLMRFGFFVDDSKNVIDEIMTVYMPAGKSYTGCEQVEIFCHGGRQVVRLIQDTIIGSGARMAEPGEFTKLAFLAGKIDLTKAESVAEIISANTSSSFETAREHLLGAYSEHIGMLREQLIDILAEIEASIDYPEEEIDPKDQEKLISDFDDLLGKISELKKSYKGGRIINEGFKIAIGGRPNAGKSSLFNLLLRQQRALVTPKAGTTRDYLSEWIDIDGFKVNIIDTAGLRKAGGTIEKEGQKSAKSILKSADLVLWLVDISSKGYKKQIETDLQDITNNHILKLYNKIDKSASSPEHPDTDTILISCKTEKGISQLKKEISARINATIPDLTAGVVVTSARHKQKFSNAEKMIKAARDKCLEKESPELPAFDLREALKELDEITGKVYNEDILGRIFAKFCIGK